MLEIFAYVFLVFLIVCGIVVALANLHEIFFHDHY